LSGHVARVGACRVRMGKLEGKRPIGKLCCMWEKVREGGFEERKKRAWI